MIHAHATLNRFSPDSQRPASFASVRERLKQALIGLGTLALIAASCACGTVRFYTQATRGQLEMLAKRQDSAQLLADPETPEALKQRLRLIDEIRVFAKQQLALPGDRAYGKYADLGREHLVWVIYAAPEFSLEPRKWRYPLVGEVNYRGYFQEPEAEAYAAQLRDQGLDVSVGGVDAYSSLGWFHDPILNTFVQYPEIDLAELIFHELSHHRYYRSDETEFNESLANAVAEEGVLRWLASRGRTAELQKFRERIVRRSEFYDEIERTRLRLEKLYASDLSESQMRSQKSAEFDALRVGFRTLRRRWGGHGLEWWLTAGINNADLVSLETYHREVPRFRELLRENQGDLERFFAAVKLLPSRPDSDSEHSVPSRRSSFSATPGSF